MNGNENGQNEKVKGLGKLSLTTLTITYKVYIMSFHRKYNSLFKLVDNSMKLYKMHKKKKQEEKKKK